MKAPRLILCAALLLGLIATAVSAPRPITTPKAKTYAVLGFYDGTKPGPALGEKAPKQIGAKMHETIQVKNPEEADHVIQVLFKRGTYKIYVDALPLNGATSVTFADWLPTLNLLSTEANFENATGHGRGGSR